MNADLNAGAATKRQSELIAHGAEPRRSRPKRTVDALRRLSCGGAVPSSSSGRSGWLVKARDLHPGDVVQQYDWPLHVRQVTLSRTTVAIAVTEFEFPLRYAADEQVRLAA